MRILVIGFWLLVISSFAVRSVYSVDATKSATQDLLDRVATKVAGLASKLRRVYTGKIKSAGTNSYVVTTIDGDKTISTNDVTSFYRIRSGNRTEVNFKSLKPGDDIAAIGTVDPNTTEMSAKQITAKIKRFNIVGTIKSIDKTIYIIQGVNGPLTKIDLSDAVSLKMINIKNQIVPASLENFKQGDLIFAIGYMSDPSSEILSVLKAINLLK